MGWPGLGRAQPWAGSAIGLPGHGLNLLWAGWLTWPLATCPVHGLAGPAMVWLADWFGHGLAVFPGNGLAGGPFHGLAGPAMGWQALPWGGWSGHGLALTGRGMAGRPWAAPALGWPGHGLV
jgi:hypothetical protein